MTNIKQIVIVGGGSAGWLTAGLLAAEHCGKNSPINITLIESPDVATIGVGEGTWPSMRSTLNRIGISEKAFICQTNASFKQGSKFVNWCDDETQHHYYHPFMTPQGYTQANLYQGWQAKHPQQPFADIVSIQGQICERGRAPKQQGTPEYASVTNYGYHLDAGKFAALLQQHCCEKLGVNHIRDHVLSIENNDDEYIAALHCKQSGRIAGDLFIDCTGSKAILIGQHYHVPYIVKTDVLFNNRALAVQLPYECDNSPINSATVSTAQEAGWIWDIGLPTRRGVGYTYSSKYQTDQQATETLRAYAAQTIGETSAQDLDIRPIQFTPGYREKFWHKNAVAVGMSAGFIEPLEASALALIELSCSMISEQLPRNVEHMQVLANRFNQRFTYRWARVIDFLKLHYVLSNRQGQYWQDHRNNKSIPESLKNLLALWQHQAPSRFDFIQNEEIFPSASYQFVLYGMGFKTDLGDSCKVKNDDELVAKIFNDNQYKIDKFSQALPSNRELIEFFSK